MTLGISSFTHTFLSTGSSDSFSTNGREFLGKLKTAFLSTSANWELYSDIETAGTSESNTNAKSTFQVHNTVTGEYVRFWCLGLNNSSGTASYTFTNTDTDSTSSTRKINYNNWLRSNRSGSNYYIKAPGFFCFGVNDSPIGVDLGYNLNLKFPIQCASLSSVLTNSSASLSQPGAITWKVVTMSDGDAFYVIFGSGLSSVICLFYSRNGLTTRQGDSYTAISGRIGNNSSMMGSANLLQAQFTTSSGSYTFEYGYGAATLGTSALYISETSTQLATAPFYAYMTVDPYTGSTSSLVKDGIGYKGVISTGLVRSVYASAVTTGVTYGGGNWMSIGGSYLIPWAPNHDADSPFLQN